MKGFALAERSVVIAAISSYSGARTELVSLSNERVESLLGMISAVARSSQRERQSGGREKIDNNLDLAEVVWVSLSQNFSLFLFSAGFLVGPVPRRFLVVDFFVGWIVNRAGDLGNKFFDRYIYL